MSVGQWYGLHEVHSLSIDLDERENISSLHCVTEGVESRRRIRTFLPGKTLLRVLGCDEVFPRLPGRGHEDTDVQLQLVDSCIICGLYVIVWLYIKTDAEAVKSGDSTNYVQLLWSNHQQNNFPAVIRT